METMTKRGSLVKRRSGTNKQKHDQKDYSGFLEN